MVKTSAKKIRQLKTDQELLARLNEYKKELAALRVIQVTGQQAAKLSKIKDFRKSIAVTMLVYHERQRAEAKTFYKGKKYVPLELRPKFTKKIRAKLSEKQEKKQTLRQRKKSENIPRRKYALMM
eukprot:Selendium_serpulae@DN2906_c0_g1_i3.p1